MNTELESIYLWGRFAVKAESADAYGPRRTIRTGGEFRLCPLPEKADIARLEREGFLFFAGEITLSRRFEMDQRGEALVRFARPDAGVTELEINGERQAFFWAPYEKRVQLHEGENEIRVTLTNSCRNLFGPHYSREGDPYAVGPFSYGRETEKMHFVRFGIDGGVEIEY